MLFCCVIEMMVTDGMSHATGDPSWKQQCRQVPAKRQPIVIRDTAKLLQLRNGYRLIKHLLGNIDE